MAVPVYNTLITGIVFFFRFVISAEYQTARRSLEWRIWTKEHQIFGRFSNFNRQKLLEYTSAWWGMLL